MTDSVTKYIYICILTIQFKYAENEILRESRFSFYYTVHEFFTFNEARDK